MQYDVYVPVVESSGWRYQHVWNVEASDATGAQLVAVTRCIVQYGLKISSDAYILTYAADRERQRIT